ncbi:MAG: transposase [Anaeroplasmataceae bacterium]|nr:transposase [Anaeroplasmataceae bacterium]
MFKTMKYHYKNKNKETTSLLNLLCHISKNIYNTTLYHLRQAYFNHKEIGTYFDVIKEIKSNENYHILNTYQSMCTLRNAHTNMMKFIKGKSYLPKYLPKNSVYPLITDQVRPILFQNKKCIKLPLSNLLRTGKVFKTSYKDNLINKFLKESRLSKGKNIYFPIPKELYDKKIHQVRIVPKNKEYYIEFSYSTIEETTISSSNDIIGIDLGISNLMAIGSTKKEGFIIDGKRLKSIYQYYNKQVAYYQSNLPKDIYQTKRLNNLRKRLESRVEDYLNKAVSQVIKYCKEEGIGRIVIGWNKRIKEGGIKNKELGGKDKHKVNQSFCNIPLSRLKNKFIFKGKEQGIETVVINEAYTSKCSFIDNDEITSTNYSGIRIKRGLYQTKEGHIINADMNAAFNMIRKYKSNTNKSYIGFMCRGLTNPSRVQVKL